MHITVPQVSPRPPSIEGIDFSQLPSIEGIGYMFIGKNKATIITGFSGNTTVFGGDIDTNLLCFGKGDVTAFFGSGRNIALGSNGNDSFSGGTGSNKLSGGAGDDLLIRGEGFNILDGGTGSDQIFFGQWDQVTGGSGADRFTFLDKMTMSSSGTVFIKDLSFNEGDVLDLSASFGIFRENMKIQYDTLVYSTEEGVVNIEGAGHQITLIGGIDAAIKAGYLSVAFADNVGKG